MFNILLISNTSIVSIFALPLHLEMTIFKYEGKWSYIGVILKIIKKSLNPGSKN
jgi:hypothetical protein